MNIPQEIGVHTSGIWTGREHRSPLVGHVIERQQIVSLMQEITALAAGLHEQVPLGSLVSSDASVRQRFAHASSDAPQCILFTGEAGIGKTRLAEECSTFANQCGWQVYWSRGWAETCGNPYQIWMGLLQELLRFPMPCPQEISEVIAPLMQNGQQRSPNEGKRGEGRDEREQLRLWEAVFQLLVCVSAHAPVLVVVDDLGWSDSLSRDLFCYLARRVRGQAILLVGTLRTYHTTGEQDPWHRPVAELLRERVVQLLAVAPLEALDVMTLSGHLSPRLSEEQLRHIQKQSAGNPFFAEELVRYFDGKDAQEDGNVPALPSTIAQILENRLRRVGEVCYQLLSKAAVLGGNFLFSTITAMTSFDEELLFEGLEEALGEGILTEDGQGEQVAYRFWHPLLVTHLYAQLPLQARSALHRQAAEVFCLEYREDVEDGAALITYHLQRGEAAPDHIRYYAWHAANRAYRLSAYPEAEQYYRLVLSCIEAKSPLAGMCVLRSVGMDTTGTEELPLGPLWELLGECCMKQGKYEEAARCYEQALSCLESPGSNASVPAPRLAEYQALLCREIGFVYRYRGDRERAWAYHQKAVQCLREAGIVGGPAWACLHYQAGGLYWQEGSYEQACQEAGAALVLFEQSLSEKETLTNISSVSFSAPLSRIGRTLLGDPVDVGRVRVLLAALLVVQGNPREATIHLLEALTLFEQQECQREIMISCDNLGDLLMRQAEYEQAQGYLQRALAIAEQIGDSPSLSVSLGNLGVLAVRCGDLQEGEHLLRKSFQIAERVQDPVYMSLWLSYLAPLLEEQGRSEEALSCIRRAYTVGRGIPSCRGAILVQLGWMRLIHVRLSHDKALRLQDGCCTCQCASCQDLLRGAEKSIKQMLQLTEVEAETRVEGQLILATTLLFQGQSEQAWHLAEQVCEEAQQGGLAWLLVHGIRLLAQIEMVLGRYELAAKRLQEVYLLFHRYGMRLEEARTLFLRGVTLCLKGVDGAGAGEQWHLGESDLREALRLVEECYAPLDQRRVAWFLHQISVNAPHEKWADRSFQNIHL